MASFKISSAENARIRYWRHGREGERTLPRLLDIAFSACAFLSLISFLGTSFIQIHRYAFTIGYDYYLPFSLFTSSSLSTYYDYLMRQVLLIYFQIVR